MATLHTGQIYPASLSATSEAAGYPAVNLASGRIRRSWRSTTTAQQQITIDLGADVVVASVWLQHCSAASVSLETKTAAGGWTAAGTLTIYQEPHGRRKGWAAVVGTYRYLRLTIAAGTPVDGEAYWEIGAVYVFAASATLPRAQDWGMQADPQFPIAAINLPNGRTVAANAGPAYSIIRVSFRAIPSEDVAQLLRQARSGLVGFASANISRPWDAWPVQHVQPNAQRKIDSVFEDVHSWDLIEVV